MSRAPAFRLMFEDLRRSCRRNRARFAAFVASLAARGWFCGLVLFLLTLVAFGPAWHAGFVWDDDVFVTNDPILIAPHALRMIWFSFDSPSQYFPLTYTSFYFERALWGLNPAGYHMVNIFLHALAAVVLWRVLKRLRIPGAWLAAAIFAIHPVQVESVAWVAERKNVLMGLFFMLTLWAWIRFVDSAGRRSARFYVLAILCYALSLSAKTTACTLPAALVLMLWLEKIPITWKRIGQIAPFAGMAGVMAMIAMAWERNHLGIHQNALATGFLERCLIASRAIWFYAGKLICPWNLCANYSKWNLSPASAASWLWPVLTLLLAAVIWKARKWAGRSVEVAALFFVLTLGPMLGLVAHALYLYTFAADHFQYLACIGLIALAAAGLTLGLTRIAPRRPLLRVIVCAALLAGLGTLTWMRSAIYESSESLWRATLEQNPDSAVAHAGVGNVDYQNGDVTAAIRHFQRAIQLNPEYIDSYYNLNACFLRAGRVDDAIACISKELGRHPDDPQGCIWLAEDLDRKGKMADAVAEYRKAISLAPDNATACGNLGVALLKWGKPDEAIVQLTKALAIDPQIAGAQVYLGIAYAKKGQPAEAVAQFTKAVNNNPSDTEARSNLGMALAQSGQVKKAIDEFQIILETNPNQMEACQNLAWLLATAADKSLRDGPRAVTLAQRASDLGGGNNPVLLHTLASAYAAVEDFPNAISTARRALDLSTQVNNSVLSGKLRQELQQYQDDLRRRGGKSPPRAGLAPGVLGDSQ